MPVIGDPTDTTTSGGGMVTLQEPWIARPFFKVCVYDPFYSTQIKFPSGQTMYPVRCSLGKGPYGGKAEILYTTHALSNEQDDLSDKLVGCYVRIFADSDILWAGVITGVQYMHEDNGGNFINQVTYFCDDLWQAIADKALRGTMLGMGLTIENLLTFLEGDPVVWGGSIGSASTPMLPLNKNNEAIIDIDKPSFHTKTSWWSHNYSNIDISRLICEVAEEKFLEGVVVVPTGTSSYESDNLMVTGLTGKIGTIRAINPDPNKWRTLVLGTYSLDDFTEQAYIPKALSFSGKLDYGAVITEIREVGGTWTQSVIDILIPAWNDSLALSSAEMISSQPNEYGMYGRLWKVDLAALQAAGINVSAIIPFSDSLLDHAYDTSGDTPKNDAIKIFEFTGTGDDYESYSNLALWKECSEKYKLCHLMAANAWRFGISPKAEFAMNNFGLIIFDTPQLRFGKVITDGVLSDDLSVSKQPKVMAFQAQIEKGQMYYSTGHKPVYPRTRYRYISNTGLAAHDTTLAKISSRAALVAFNSMMNINRTGIYPAPPSVQINALPALQDEALQNQKRLSRPKSSVRVTLAGIDKSWMIGDRIKQIIDTAGNVVKDNLEWYVSDIEWNLEEVTTELSLGELRYG